MTDLNHIALYLREVFIDQLNTWVVLGFIAQALFAARFLVQWIASERARRSVIPISFWIFSVIGGLFLFIYALYRRDPVFIAGQGLGLLVYIRNLMLIRKNRSSSGAEN